MALRGMSIVNLVVSIGLLGLAGGYTFLVGDQKNLLPVLQRISGGQIALIVAAITLSVLLGAARLHALAVFGASALGVWLGLWRRARLDDGCKLGVLLLAGLGTMSLVHDLMFQRMTYFALGLALACSGGGAQSRRGPTGPG